MTTGFWFRFWFGFGFGFWFWLIFQVLSLNLSLAGVFGWYWLLDPYVWCSVSVLVLLTLFTRINSVLFWKWIMALLLIGKYLHLSHSTICKQKKILNFLTNFSSFVKLQLWFLKILRHTIIEDSHETKKKRKWVPKLEEPSSNGLGGLLRRFSKRDRDRGMDIQRQGDIKSGVATTSQRPDFSRAVQAGRLRISWFFLEYPNFDKLVIEKNIVLSTLKLIQQYWA